MRHANLKRKAKMPSDEANSPLNRELSEACENPNEFDFGFVDARIDSNLANFGVDEETHRSVFAAFGVEYPADQIEEEIE